MMRSRTGLCTLGVAGRAHLIYLFKFYENLEIVEQLMR